MKIELEDFQNILDENGIKYKLSGISIVLQECPECGLSDWKVLLKVGNFLGRCMHGSCEQGYSSYSYLVKSGVPVDQVKEVHGVYSIEHIGKIAEDQDKLSILTKDIDDQEKTEEVKSIRDFFTVEEWPEHPVAQYAISRGYSKEMSKWVMCDVSNNAVVFICYDSEDESIGYQRRFINAKSHIDKARFSYGFNRYGSVFELPKKCNQLLISEGPFTAVSGWHYGYYSIATFGSKITDDQLEKISDIADENEITEIGVAVELDKPGEIFFKRIYFYFNWFGIRVHRVEPNTNELKSDLNDAWVSGVGITVKKDINIDPAIPDIELF